MDSAAQLNMEQLKRFDLLYAPYTSSHYSNLGLALLGRSLERAWGQQYEDYIVNEILLPLNMTSSGFNYTAAVKKQLVTGYLVETMANGTLYTIPTPGADTVDWSWGAPAGGMYVSRADMIKFMKWVLARDLGTDSILQQQYKDQYLSPGMNLADGISQYGMGTWETFYTKKHWAMTKGGLTTSMATSLAFVPSLKLGLVVMCNINSGSLMDSLSAQSMNILIPAFNKLLTAPYKHPMPANYEQLMGSYGGSQTKPWVTIGTDENTPTTGIFVGQISIQGPVQFTWDPNANPSEGMVAFRYPAGEEGQSCMLAEGSALLYISTKGVFAGI